MKNQSRKLSLLPLLLACSPLVAHADPTQWKIEDGGNGHYYEVILENEITWPDAEAAAGALNYFGVPGYLATSTSDEENTFINNLRVLSTTGEVWLGGKQDPPGDCCSNWTWITDEGLFPGVNGPGVYSNWADGEPNDAGGNEMYLGLGRYGDATWNDEAALQNITGYVVEYGTDEETPVAPGENVLFFDKANDPNSPNPLTAGYQKVLEGGAVKVSCCRVLDTREGGKKYQPNQFDLGLAVADTALNPSCAGMPTIGQGTAVLHKWQRGVPKSKGIIVDGSVARENDLGVCVIESDVASEGVLFQAEEASKVLGYKLNCAENSVDYRPFTGSVHLDPAEVDAPFVVRRSADCDLTRSGFRASTNVMVVNLRHDRNQMATDPYLGKDAANLKGSIDAIKAEGSCVDNSNGFLDAIASLTQSAKQDMQKAAKKGDKFAAQAAVNALDAATKLALLIDLPAKYGSDPYAGGVCPLNPNPKALLASRLMGLRFAACSELLFAGETEASDSSINGNCAIIPSIWNALPALPGQLRCQGPGCEPD